MSKTKSTSYHKPWDGVFSAPVEPSLEAFSASVSVDRALAEVDLTASAAHADMLHSAGILSQTECETLKSGIETIRQEIRSDRFIWKTQLEDVHMNIEARLIELCGETGKRLHTARSRNDQVATDMRLYLRQQCADIGRALTDVQTALVNLAAQHTDTIMPGYTHLQPAQPIVLGHHLLAWYEALQRDWQRLVDQQQRLNIMPLGSAALAGTGWPIDRQLTCRALNFIEPSRNSLDSISDRDFLLEFSAGASISMMHLSRITEELILWVNPAFGFIELPDSWCTGSSIMPQKKNPDALELIRGKTGHCYGALFNLLTLMKAQPLTYNRDMQEDKLPALTCARQWLDSLSIMAALIPAIQIRPERMRAALKLSWVTATDLADYLVAKGLAFRDAHRLTGQIVQLAIEQQVELDELPLEQLRRIYDQIEDDVYQRLSLEGSVAARCHLGGTAPASVGKEVERARRVLSERSAIEA